MMARFLDNPEQRREKVLNAIAAFDPKTELAEAEAAFAASTRAIQTHGHQAVSWAFYKADAERVTALRKLAP